MPRLLGGIRVTEGNNAYALLSTWASTIDPCALNEPPPASRLRLFPRGGATALRSWAAQGSITDAVLDSLQWFKSVTEFLTNTELDRFIVRIAGLPLAEIAAFLSFYVVVVVVDSTL